MFILILFFALYLYDFLCIISIFHLLCSTDIHHYSEDHLISYYSTLIMMRILIKKTTSQSINLTVNQYN